MQQIKHNVMVFFIKWLVKISVISPCFSIGSLYLATLAFHKIGSEITEPIAYFIATSFGILGLLIGTPLFWFFLKGSFFSGFFGTIIFKYIDYLYHFKTFQNKMIFSFGLGFVLYLIYLIIKLFKWSKSVYNINKTLEEIDQLGNGDTYEKGRLFEEYVANLYRKFGYKAWTTTEMRKAGKLPGDIQKRGGSGEQGVDVLVFDHESKQNVIIQCKHYSNKVSNSAIQEIVAAKPLYKAQKAIVITNQTFTEPAKELAKSNNVQLIDRQALADLIQKAVHFKK